MKRALTLARRGLADVAPNPAVGAVVVRSGKIVGKGWHQRPGEAHAEVIALNDAGDAARGATLYVTLEPCNHFGKTPPCCEKIIASGIKRVVIAMLDPNRGVKGGGAEYLRAKGLKVEVGLFAYKAQEINRGWLSYLDKSRPYVVLKMAMSLDSCIARKSDRSCWISGESSRAQVHRLRGRFGAIMVGSGTVRIDDPQLSNRSNTGSRPVRVILDGNLKSSVDSKVYNLSEKEGGEEARTVVFTSRSAPAEQIRALKNKGVEVYAVGLENRQDLDGKVSDARCSKFSHLALDEVLATLSRLGVQSVLCEGGGRLACSLIEKGLADELMFYIAPKFFGADGISIYSGYQGILSDFMVKYNLVNIARVKEDALLIYRA